MVSDSCRVALMPDYPVMMRLRGRRCVVVGAGPVGVRKANTLLAAGAVVVLVDPRLESLSVPDAVEKRPRDFTEKDLEGAALAFAATGSTEVNRSVAAAARRRGIPVNLADDAEESDFIVPASFRSGGLTVAVATGGSSPALAALVRDEIEKILPGEWAIFLEIAAKLRARLLTSGSKTAYNQQVLRDLVSVDLLAKIAGRDEAGIDRILATAFGSGTSLAELGISLSKGTS